MSYEIYKIIHIVAIIGVFASLAVSLSTPAGEVQVKHKILNGLMSFLILVAGMGLLARIGIKHGEGFPTWVIGKFVAWGLIVIGGPIAIKRMKTNREKMSLVFILIGIAAIVIAIYKP
ncbi:MAG: SirB2 family protein [Halobacteriovoraceae bacterium]|nr:SirB2 family protein [Halobacteriovoraceae bacterium]